MLGRQPVNLIKTSGNACPFAVHTDLDCWIGLAPDDLHRIAGIAQHGHIPLTLSGVRSNPRMILSNARPPSARRSKKETLHAVGGKAPSGALVFSDDVGSVHKR